MENMNFSNFGEFVNFCKTAQTESWSNDDITSFNKKVNSLIEKDGLLTSLSMVVVDGDKPSAEFLKKKIDSITSQKKTTYGECDIMYSYEIEGDMHEKDSYSR